MDNETLASIKQHPYYTAFYDRMTDAQRHAKDSAFAHALEQFDFCIEQAKSALIAQNISDWTTPNADGKTCNNGACNRTYAIYEYWRNVAQEHGSLLTTVGVDWYQRARDLGLNIASNKLV